MEQANGTSEEVARKVASAIFKAKGWPGVVMFDISELKRALEYGIDIYSGNAAKVFGKQ
jgi:hypothetical protein